jgi:dTDP-4-amino-4,6-dideoxygalactose transaminase
MFEEEMASYVGVKTGAALSSGTAALHMAVKAAGVKQGDVVFCSSLTFSASANPICYQGAKPIFVDSELETWNMCPIALENAIIDRHNVTGKYPKVIIPVHLYGMPAKMDEIMAIANKYNIPVLEDAAEALGSEYKGVKCGTMGTYGALSFNGNKIITTSGGGALICPDAETGKRVTFYATQARENRPYYYHEVIGYNYRLSNVSAGIGCGQMDVLEEHVARRQEIHSLYKDGLKDISCISVLDNPTPDYSSNFWLTTILIDPKCGITPDEVRIALNEENIETRLLWRPMHTQPIYKDVPYYGGDVCEKLFEQGLCLPSGSSLTDEDINRVIIALRNILAK